MRRSTDFFSAAGRSPRTRLVLVLGIAWVFAWLCAPAWESESILPFIAAGFVMGAVIAKASAEIARRLHDMGSGVIVGVVVALVCLLFVGAAHLEALARDGPWVSWSNGLALAALALLLAWPGSRTLNRFGAPAPAPWLTSMPESDRPDRSRWLVPLMGIAGAETVVLIVGLLAYGMEQSNHNGLDFARRSAIEHQREVVDQVQHGAKGDHR